MLIECNRCQARVDGEVIGFVDEDDFVVTRTCLIKCPSCGGPLVGVTDNITSEDGKERWSDVVRVHPKPRRLLARSIPQTVRNSIEEAERCLQAGAFLAAAAMSGRALEAVCRYYSTKDTYIGAGIKELRDKGIIDARLYQWSEELRDQRNMAAHATEAAFSAQDAEDILTFTYAIVDYVFLLTRKFEQFQARKKERIEGIAKKASTS